MENVIAFFIFFNLLWIYAEDQLWVVTRYRGHKAQHTTRSFHLLAYNRVLMNNSSFRLTKPN